MWRSRRSVWHTSMRRRVTTGNSGSGRDSKWACVTERPVPMRRRVSPELVAFVVTAALYTTTATRYVLGGDNAEFVALAADGGVAHPPGYPLYVLYLRALHGIPAATPAHAAALAT